jgi:hypothetical protein
LFLPEPGCIVYLLGDIITPISMGGTTPTTIYMSASIEVIYLLGDTNNTVYLLGDIPPIIK